MTDKNRNSILSITSLGIIGLAIWKIFDIIIFIVTTISKSV